jgi:hypothetical protein
LKRPASIEERLLRAFDVFNMCPPEIAGKIMVPGLWATLEADS